MAASTAAEEACAQCHEVALDVFAASPHGFLDCATCHPGATELPHPPGVGAPDCAACRACHGSLHALVSRGERRSPVHPLRLAQTCGACHADPEMAKHSRTGVIRPLEAYLGSVHARALEAGEDAPSCAGCHGAHGILPAADPRSRVHYQRVADTCGGCHGDIAKAYRASVHGEALARGVREAPTCTDCHGEHHILAPGDAGSPVRASAVPRRTCGRCHGDLQLAQRFGMAADRVPAFEESFHGLALRSGVTTVAHCGSCHGVHDILPSSDPRSHVHPDHLVATCGQCHPGAGKSFAIGAVHVIPGGSEHVAVRVARVAYLWLIVLVVGGMLLHNGLDFLRKLREAPLPAPPVDPTAAERMGRGFRIAHGTLVVSFLLLVYTGFALAFPEAWWARPLLTWEEKLALRGALHRAAAILLLGALAFHLAHLCVDRGARACIAGMRPTRQDLRELRERVAWLLGRRREPPRTGPLGYVEKVEYLAVLWGCAVMTITGVALWQHDLLLRWLPKWVADLATVVHFYEAVLASLAIGVWHLYFVIFDPVVYPMDKAWLTGRSHPGRVRERSGGEDAGSGPGESARG